MSMAWDRSNVSREYQPPGAIRSGLIRVDPENLDHALFLYRLLEEAPPEQSISHKPVPTFSEHVEFVQGRPYLAWYLVGSAVGVLVGSIYITRRREIGLSIAQAHRRQGHGGLAVREVMRIHHDADEPFLANLNPQNEASIKFWESLGFKLMQVTYARGPHDASSA